LPFFPHSLYPTPLSPRRAKEGGFMWPRFLRRELCARRRAGLKVTVSHEPVALVHGQVALQSGRQSPQRRRGGSASTYCFNHFEAARHPETDFPPSKRWPHVAVSSPFRPGGGGEGLGERGGIQKQQSQSPPRANQRTKPTLCQLNLTMARPRPAMPEITQFANAAIPVWARPRISA